MFDDKWSIKRQTVYAGVDVRLDFRKGNGGQHQSTILDVHYIKHGDVAGRFSTLRVRFNPAGDVIRIENLTGQVPEGI